MGKKFTEYKGLDLSAVGSEMLKQWDAEDAFGRSIETREGCPPYIFYEGPPSANGTPGIHHVMARAIKDVFCRYKTQKGFLVHRKAGWDTHGLPVELGVEKKLGITKEDIGKTISIEEYNRQCREEVMKYTDEWNRLTKQMGYWVDMEHPYITYENTYIETLWWILKQLFEKGLLYKGYTIQPYSPAAGTGLSNHELNQPGCYRDVKDTTCVAQFKVIRNEASEKLFAGAKGDLYFLAWTTTPWTLPSNMALAVGPNIQYSVVVCENPYTKREQTIVLASDLVEKTMAGSKIDPENYQVIAQYTGPELEGIRYEQLIPWVRPAVDEINGGGLDAFRVIVADYVTTEEGTGMVHIAGTFGADDDRESKKNGIAPMLLLDKAGKWQPMVDRTGRFYRIEDLDEGFVAKYVDESYREFAGVFVKNDYDPTKTEKDETLDVAICMMLKANNQAFRIEKYTHNYPHCWRTDKPILYYPLDSWFVKTTAVKEQLMKLNATINWKPVSTGEGRFGKWLENLVDWNLSRSRYWGTPLPIWATEDRSQLKCVGSVAELKTEIDKSVAAGFMTENPLADFTEDDFSKENYNSFDLHRPYVDQIVLVSDDGQRMEREADLIDVWFDSGAMPYAQVHYPFEVSGADFNNVFPADFIAEGVDQTRGWFFTLHALATMLFDSVAFKNIISNGLVLDKKGNKMSKRWGNAVDPFEVMDKYGADATRWYMISNSQPWDNLKFDADGVDEVRRKFFGTLYNTYSFFALYANVDGFDAAAPEIPVADRPEIDRWIISLLNTLIGEVTEALENYDPTPAARAISRFVDEHLSNWYVRLNRKRFWGGEMTDDKLAAYQTLYQCLVTVVQLAAPFAPFLTDKLYRDLKMNPAESVHVSKFPEMEAILVDKPLEERMELAQRASSMVLALRRKVNIKVRQPLQKMIIPVSLNRGLHLNFMAVEEMILSEVNVKEVEYMIDTAGVITKKIKPNFKTLGPKYGQQMKQIVQAFEKLDQQTISDIEALFSIDTSGRYMLAIASGEELALDREDFEITSEDMPGWLVATEGALTIALDVEVSPELRMEGIARELVNRIQNIRKDSGFDVTDKIKVVVESNPETDEAVTRYADYIAGQTLAQGGVTVGSGKQSAEIEIDDLTLTIAVEKI